MKKVAVIGAGMAGAGAAWFLRKAGFEVTIFEASSEVGGRAKTYRGDGFHCNTGAGFFTSFYPLLRSLLKETGLESDIHEKPKAITLAKEGRHYTYKLDSFPSFLGIPFLSLGDKWRVMRLTIALTLKKKQLDLVNPEALAVHDLQSIADYATERLGKNAFEHLVRSAIEPYWYFSCEQASAAMLKGLQAHAPGARFFTLNSGMDSLARTMFKDMDLRLSSPISALSLPRSGGIGIEAPANPSLHFDAAVVATTASAAMQLLRPLGDRIPPPLSAFLSSQTYASNINAYFSVPKELVAEMSPQISPITSDNHGLAAIATHGARVDQNRRPGETMLGAWMLDNASRKLMDEAGRPAGEEAYKAYVLQEIWKTMRIYRNDLPEAVPPLGKLSIWREAIPIHAPGRYRLAADAWRAQKPPLVYAGDCMTTATMEGALTAGRRAAQILIDRL